MSANLEHFLHALGASASTEARWTGRFAQRFQVDTYVSAMLPPTDLTTSVRAIVRVRDKLVALQNRDGIHILPGGRLEPGESHLGALHREIEEETGLVPTWTSPAIGFLHFRHLMPRLANYPYPYPNMFHLVFVTDADGEPRSGDVDGYEERAFLVSHAEALTLADNFVRPLLHAALEIRR